MRFRSLRTLSQDAVRSHAALALWRRRGIVVDYVPLPQYETLVEVVANDENSIWTGFIDLAEWLAHVAPELAGFASHDANSLTQVRQLFEADRQPLQLPLSELSYVSLRTRLCNPSRTNERDRYVSFMTPQGRIWLDSFPFDFDGEAVPPDGGTLSVAAYDFPLRIDFLLGRSAISRSLFDSVARGDVLLIQAIVFFATSVGHVIGQFSITEQGSIFMEAMDINDEDTSKPTQVALNDIPLQLEFILQRRVMSVAQLDALYQGQYLQLDPQAERKIEIMANGVKLATGELVELNDQLGIEIIEIASRKKARNDK